MNKSNSKQVLKNVFELAKQKVSIYPYYSVTASYKVENGHFLFSVQYPNQVSTLTATFVKHDNVHKNSATSIDLLGINDRSGISTVQVIDLKYSQMSKSVWIDEGVFLVGFRQGQLVLIKYKDKHVHVVLKLNKLIKKQSIMSRASSFISGEEAYKVMIKGPIKSAQYHPQRQFAISYLIDNTIVFLKKKDQLCQQSIQKVVESPDWQLGKQFRYCIDEGMLLSIPHTQISSFCYTEQEQIFVNLSMESKIQCYSGKELNLLYTIQMSMPIRKINYYSFPEGNYLVVMPYQDYLIIIDLNKHRFIKMLGHRCFIANCCIYRNETNKLVLVSGGMDHRLCFDKIEDIQGWHAVKQLEKGFYVNQDMKGVTFGNKYSTGQYQNARTNSHDYGFSDLLMVANLIVIPTYDSKVKAFQLNYR